MAVSPVSVTGPSDNTIQILQKSCTSLRILPFFILLNLSIVCCQDTVPSLNLKNFNNHDGIVNGHDSVTSLTHFGSYNKQHDSRVLIMTLRFIKLDAYQKF